MNLEECDFVIANDNSGDFSTFNQALKSEKFWELSADEGVKLFVKSGTYKEKIVFEEKLGKVELYGEDPENTILTYDNYA